MAGIRVFATGGVEETMDISADLETAGVPVVGYQTDRLDGDEIDDVIDEAIAEMQRQGITGKDTTPFLLARIAERTDGRSLEANIQLVINNARVAARIAMQL